MTDLSRAIAAWKGVALETVLKEARDVVQSLNRAVTSFVDYCAKLTGGDWGRVRAWLYGETHETPAEFIELLRSMRMWTR